MNDWVRYLSEMDRVARKKYDAGECPYVLRDCAGSNQYNNVENFGNPHWLDTSEIDEAKMNEGVKYDEEKPQYSLVPQDALHEVAKVLTFGAKKYAPDNWKKVPDLQRRYYDALQRHLYAYQKGETLDPESGLHHLAHAGCCLFFMLQDNLEESE